VVPPEAKRSARYSTPSKVAGDEPPALIAYTNTSPSEIPPELELDELLELEDVLELDELLELEDVLEVDELLELELEEVLELDELVVELPPHPVSATVSSETKATE